MRKTLANINLYWPQTYQPKSYRLGIADASAALLESSGWWRQQIKQVGERIYSPSITEPWDNLRAELNELIGNATGTRRPLAIVVANQWARLFVVTPPHNASTLNDCAAAAAMRFQELYGDSARHWKIKANWHATQAFVACAIPATFIEMLLTTANQHRMTITSVVPHFIAAWNRWHHQLDGTAWFGVAQGNHLELAIINDGKICALQALNLPEHAWHDPQWMTTQLARQALMRDVPTAKKLQLCGHLPNWPGKNTPSPDTGCRLVTIDVIDARSPGKSDSAAVQLAHAARTP